MKAADNVVPINPDVQAPPVLVCPKYFKVAQKVAWNDLVDSAAAEVVIKENRFTFEMAAVLMAKFRSGKPMNATESKELKKQLIALGLQKDDEAEGGKKKSKNAAKYFGG